MSDYRLCKQAKLKLWPIVALKADVGKEATWVLARDVESLLASAPIMAGEANKPSHQEWTSWRKPNDTHLGRILLIEEINKEPEEIRLLREFVACCKVDDPKLRWGELRAYVQEFLKRRDSK